MVRTLLVRHVSTLPSYRGTTWSSSSLSPPRSRSPSYPTLLPLRKTHGPPLPPCRPLSPLDPNPTHLNYYRHPVGTPLRFSYQATQTTSPLVNPDLDVSVPRGHPICNPRSTVPLTKRTSRFPSGMPNKRKDPIRISFLLCGILFYSLSPVLSRTSSLSVTSRKINT